jgi:isocitrate dehydrogenase
MLSSSSSSSVRYLSSSTSVSVPNPPTSNHLHEPLPKGKVKGEILYTETDEAPALATYSLYPVIRKFAALGSVDIVPCDISVAGRVLAAFPEMLHPEQRVPDNLSYLGHCTLQPDCSIVKLPNISAPINQLQDCIAELRSKGYNVPLYPTDPKTPEQKAIQERYNKLAGSAVNPVLREGNSDRRVAPPVKAYAQKNPHRMGLWSKASRTHVAHMVDGDFYATEVSKIIPKETSVEILFDSEATGERKILKAGIQLHKDQVVDASFLSVKKLQQFYRDEIQDAKELDLLLSLHLKATMMKISDPVLFGHCIKVFYEKAYDKHEALLREIGANPNSGLGSMYEVIQAKLPASEADAVIADFEACYEDRPWLAMVNSDKGITNLHAPNDIIIDASMPVVVRDSGKMWNKLNELEDVKCLIPDRCYATMYQEVISYVKTHGQFDVATMGNVVRIRSIYFL